jgi:hypothetical protein
MHDLAQSWNAVCVCVCVYVTPNLNCYTTQAFELRKMRIQHQKQLSFILIFFLRRN